MQEMFEEYFRGLKVASSTAKTFHLRVFLFFDLIQEPLTPAEYADGYDFFRTSRWPFLPCVRCFPFERRRQTLSQARPD